MCFTTAHHSRGLYLSRPADSRHSAASSPSTRTRGAMLTDWKRVLSDIPLETNLHHKMLTSFFPRFLPEDHHKSP